MMRSAENRGGLASRRMAIAAAVGALAVAATPVWAAVVTGDGSDNVLFGTNAADTIDGQAGNDILFGRGGADLVKGGPDGIVERVFGGTGVDTLQGEAGFDRIYSQDGRSETLSGGDDRDVIYAADSDADSIDCGAGANDAVIADPADQVVNCEEVVTATGVFDNVPAEVGTDGNDVLVGAEQVFGKAGRDVLRSRVPDAFFYPGPGRDVVDEGSGGKPGIGGHEVIDDDGDRDVIRSGPGNDGIYSAGEEGVVDVIDCGAGIDRVYADRSDVLEDCEQVFRRPR